MPQVLSALHLRPIALSELGSDDGRPGSCRRMLFGVRLTTVEQQPTTEAGSGSCPEVRLWEVSS
jgi:hypothetical protein